MRKLAYAIIGAALVGFVAAPAWAGSLSSSKAAFTFGDLVGLGAPACSGTGAGPCVGGGTARDRAAAPAFLVAGESVGRQGLLYEFYAELCQPLDVGSGLLQSPTFVGVDPQGKVGNRSDRFDRGPIIRPPQFDFQ